MEAWVGGVIGKKKSTKHLGGKSTLLEALKMQTNSGPRKKKQKQFILEMG